MSDSLQLVHYLNGPRCGGTTYGSYIGCNEDEGRCFGIYPIVTKIHAGEIEVPDMYGVAYTGILSIAERVRLSMGSLLVHLGHPNILRNDMRFMPREVSEWKIARLFKHHISDYSVHRDSSLSFTYRDRVVATWNWVQGGHTTWAPPAQLVSYTAGGDGSLVGIAANGSIYLQNGRQCRALQGAELDGDVEISLLKGDHYLITSDEAFWVVDTAKDVVTYTQQGRDITPFHNGDIVCRRPGGTLRLLHFQDGIDSSHQLAQGVEQYAVVRSTELLVWKEGGAHLLNTATRATTPLPDGICPERGDIHFVTDSRKLITFLKSEQAPFPACASITTLETGESAIHKLNGGGGVVDVLPLPDGRFLYATKKAGLFLFNEEGRSELFSGGEYGSVDSLRLLPNGSIAARGEEGLFLFAPADEKVGPYKERLILGDDDFSYAYGLIHGTTVQHTSYRTALLPHAITATTPAPFGDYLASVRPSDETRWYGSEKRQFAVRRAVLKERGVALLDGVDPATIDSRFRGRHFERIELQGTADHLRRQMRTFGAKQNKEVVEALPRFFEAARALQHEGDRIYVSQNLISYNERHAFTTLVIKASAAAGYILACMRGKYNPTVLVFEKGNKDEALMQRLDVMEASDGDEVFSYTTRSDKTIQIKKSEKGLSYECELDSDSSDYEL